MNDKQKNEVTNLAQGIVRQLNVPPAHVDIKSISDMGVGLIVWHGLLRVEIHVSLETIYQCRSGSVDFLLGEVRGELAYRLAEAYEGLDRTGKVLHDILTGKQEGGVLVVDVGMLPQDASYPIARSVFSQTIVRLQPYHVRGQTALAVSRIWAYFHEEEYTLYKSLPGEAANPLVGFDLFIQEMTDMKRALLRKEALDDILQELGRREKNHNSIFGQTQKGE